ncbi:TCP-1/cpn60 chaperonin family protein [Candidatus Micrarchaeota archaeon]|nr:TCP-1/cpn60 chaperonin family protein [Candidatus Micrarchaeota archaeon]
MTQADQMAQQQVIFLTEGSKRVRGRDAQRINILIAKAVANAVKSTLGPKGMDKMIVDELGDVTISNDGATILSEMSIDHPAGKMMVEIAKTQDQEVGDGTTTAVVLAGGLLHKAEKLLDDDIHPSIIINGYRMAAKKAKEYYEETADAVSFKDVKTLKDIAITSMTGKAAEACTELADLVIDAVKAVAEEENGKTVIDIEQIKVEKKGGTSLAESQLIKGVVLDKEIVHTGMPRKINNAKIALIDSALEIKSPETDAKIQITSPDQLQGFLDQEEGMLRKMVDKIKSAGANVVVCQKGIDDMAQHFLAKEKIMAVRRAKKSDMDLLAKATGGKVVSRIEDLSKDDLGFAQTVYEKKIADEDMTFIEGCKNPKAVTILVRGGSEHVIDEAERAIRDAIGSVTSAIKNGKIVSGGGSSEVEVAMKLREFSKTVGGREQLAIEAFAETLEIIPRTLAETAGVDPIDMLVGLRAAHKGKEGKYMGVDVYTGKIGNMLSKKVIEPLGVKTQAINSAAEVAEMLLRIDDIIAGSSKAPSMPPGGMPPGMGGMGEY